MARLKAHGNEIARVTREKLVGGVIDERWSWVLMSDGHVLTKLDCRHTDGRWDAGTWSLYAPTAKYKKRERMAKMPATYRRFLERGKEDGCVLTRGPGWRDAKELYGGES